MAPKSFLCWSSKKEMTTDDANDPIEEHEDQIVENEDQIGEHEDDVLEEHENPIGEQEDQVGEHEDDVLEAHEDDSQIGEHEDERIQNFWQMGIRDHYYGQFSMAALQGTSKIIEDRSQVEVENNYVFCGVYDGHEIDSASTYVLQKLYQHFTDLVRDPNVVSNCVLVDAITRTESGFLDMVGDRMTSGLNTHISRSGSCCLICVLNGQTLHYANLGDSRAVMCSVNAAGNMKAKQLTEDHNFNVTKARLQYVASHPGNLKLVKKVNGKRSIGRRVKVTRSIGDACLKMKRFALDPSNTLIRWPVLSAKPSVNEVTLKQSDSFIIIATAGLWECLKNAEAAAIVHDSPREGAATRLVRGAMIKKAAENGMSYEQLKDLDIPSRRQYFDDMSVIILFIDQDFLNNPKEIDAQVSVQAPLDLTTHQGA